LERDQPLFRMTPDGQQLDEGLVRALVLRAIVLNRRPGYHFLGNFLRIGFAKEAEGDCRVGLPAAPYCLGMDGQAHIGALAVVADMALAGSVRSLLSDSARLATVNLGLQFTGAEFGTSLDAAAHYQGDLQQVVGRQGLAQGRISNAQEMVCFGSGAFMVMPPPPGKILPATPWINAPEDYFPELDQADLSADEARVVDHVEYALGAARSGEHGFLDHFLGFLPVRDDDGASCLMANGPHISNRVGHVQGGIQFALGAATACAALGPDWTLSGINACFLKPGQGAQIQARARILHKGRFTAVVRTRISGAAGQMLEVMSTHAAKVQP